ncbi:AraC-like ligand binding domain-containing protein [Pustulibacterium marinum]|uniref:AraC-like ligand binding domain-containing protein n=1 Tax=Pustulibacterium marinum TaxID=1224947 RepID=A0A1I7INA7_9FLAO|nr:AraC family transcriptional regulator [Pustulibacterium marinum]SFU74410.1 AraC-like ligand binding domain-containing protein [Pustulibacterium marinum]
MSSKYYLTDVDHIPQSFYCYHDLMGEQFIEWHSHQKGQFLYTEGGVVFVHTPSATHYLPARHFMYIPPNTKHAIYPSSPKVVMRNLYFPLKNTDGTFFYKEGIYPTNNLLLELLMYTKNWKGNILKKEFKKYAVVNALKVLVESTTSQPLLLNLPQATEERLVRVINYMVKHLEEEQQITRLAAKFNMSEKSLYRLFKKDVSMSFIRYYTLLRIFKSLEYLLETNYTIAEIAGLVGYNSVPTFSNTFTKIMDKRPSEYRKSTEIYNS